MKKSAFKYRPRTYATEDTVEPFPGRVARLKMLYSEVSHMGKDDGRLDEEPGGDQTPPSAGGEKSAYGSIKHTFGDDDLENHEVCKVIAKRLIGENEDLTKEVARLKIVEESCYEKREEAAVLGTQLENMRETVGLSSILLTAGGVFAGLIFVDNPGWWRFGFGVLAVACFVTGTVWNIFKRKKNK